MNQFKPIFLGNVAAGTDLVGLKRAVNSQKCIRAGGKHNDLDDVGKDVYHHTFFEMLGSWSFGDYFKDRAIAMAWECLTEVYKLDKERLYVTYFGGDEKAGVPCDEEARQLWLKYLPEERVLPFDAKDNFWEMGNQGPCGPCSEIHYDRKPGRNSAHLVNMDSPEVIEIWNLVFMQYNRKDDGTLEKLPATHVDTGMGLERLTSVLQDKESNYDTDTFVPIFEKLQEVTGFEIPYGGKVGADDTTGVDTAYRIIADHIRTLTIAITDGVLPDNTGRGYVLRRVLRRASRTGKVFFGQEEPFFYKLAPTVVEILGDSFPELKAPGKLEFVQEQLREEEESFLATLSKGLEYFNKEVVAKKLKPTKSTVVSGQDAFNMYTRYGFPIDLVEINAEEQGYTVDKKQFSVLIELEKEASRQARKKGRSELKLVAKHTDKLSNDGVPETDFSFMYEVRQGYDIKSKVVGLFKNDEFHPSLKSEVSESKQEPTEVGVILDRTCFYAESGGQTFDTGTLFTDDFCLSVRDTQRFAGYVLHIGTITSGSVNVGDDVTCEVDIDRRKRILPNHTFTHVLNHSLRTECGEGCDQRGSRVLADKLTFDFSSKPVPAKSLIEVEKLTRVAIDAAMEVYCDVVPLEKAMKIKTLRAVFGESYPDPVRVVSIGKDVKTVVEDPDNDEWANYSVELCGGTHLSNTKHCKYFVLVSEGAVAKGIRRIVALTGNEAHKAINKGSELLQQFEEAKGLEGAELNKRINSLDQALQEASLEGNIPVSYSVRHVLSNTLKTLRKKNLKWAKKQQKEREQKVLAVAKTLAEERKGSTEPIIELFDAGMDTKILQKVCATLQKAVPDQPVMAFSTDPSKADPNARKPPATVCVYCSVPDSVHQAKGFGAGDWVTPVAAVLNGRGNGKAKTAQGQGSAHEKVNDAIQAARQFLSS